MSQQSLFERIVSNESENRTTKSVIKFYLITQMNPSGIESCILSGDIIVRNLHVSGIWKIFQFASTIYTLQPWRWRHEVWDTFEFRIIPEENKDIARRGPWSWDFSYAVSFCLRAPQIYDLPLVDALHSAMYEN